MYRIHKSVDIDFAHHIRGHAGNCIHIHGHTWKFEVCLSARELDREGFVVDFRLLRERVLGPCHALLDHSLALGGATYDEVVEQLGPLGETLTGSRLVVLGKEHFEELSARGPGDVVRLHGAENRYPGGLRVTVFPFAPTSERLAEWLFGAAQAELGDERVHVVYARVYETLHPVESVAEFRGESQGRSESTR